MKIKQVSLEKALKIIPTGNQFKSKNPRTFDEENWPAYFNKSKGVNIWDLNNRKFLDMSTMSVGTNVLGYSDNFVDKGKDNFKRNNVVIELS